LIFNLYLNNEEFTKHFPNFVTASIQTED